MSEPTGGQKGLLDNMDASAQSSATSGNPSDPVAPCAKKGWIGIRMVDSDGQPVPGLVYRIELPDGTVEKGKLDSKGSARVTEIDPGMCDITFPELAGQEWSASAG